MQNYKFLEHTADIMFEAYGNSYPEALENAAKAMFSVLGPAKCKRKASFKLSAENLEELTLFSLSELLTYMDIHGLVFSEIKVKRFDEAAKTLEFEACGEKKAPKDSIKAVTYHQLLVQKSQDGKWTIRVLLDV
ncbi:MAG: archease [Candidatus Anstonellaceae archaeon]